MTDFTIQRAQEAHFLRIAEVHFRAHSHSFAAFAEREWIESRDLDHYRQFWAHRSADRFSDARRR